MKTNKNNKGGFSLVELIVYIALLSILVSALTMTAVSLLHTFTRVGASQDVAEASIVALERITREIRFANTVNLGASTLSTSPGTLVLSSVDASNNPTTITFTLSGGQILFSQGGVPATPLTHSDITITSLVFTHSLGVNTEGVRIEFTAEKKAQQETVTKDFRTFVVLDAS